MTIAKRKARPGIKGSEAPAELTRDHILKSAAKLFRDQGYVATTLRQIADAAGIQAGSVYYHFRSKDEILTEILDTGIDEVRKSVAGRLGRRLPQASKVTCWGCSSTVISRRPASVPTDSCRHT